MATHIQNTIIIVGGPQKKIKTFLNGKFGGEQQEFCFNKIVPAPKEPDFNWVDLYWGCGWGTYDFKTDWFIKKSYYQTKALIAQWGGFTPTDEQQNLLNLLTNEEMTNILLGEKLAKNVEFPFGIIGGSLMYGFHTRYGTGMKVYKALSARYPEASFRIQCASEDWSSELEVVTLRGGEVIKEWKPNGAKQKSMVHMAIRGYNLDEYVFHADGSAEWIRHS